MRNLHPTAGVLCTDPAIALDGCRRGAKDRETDAEAAPDARTAALPATHVKFVVALLLACLSFGARAEIVWQDAYKDVRVGRVGTVIWVYWFGFDGQVRHIRRRVIDLDGVTVEMQAQALSWAGGKNPSLPGSPVDETVWDDPKTAEARTAMEAAIALEWTSNTVPQPPPALTWHVAPNPLSTTTPPTRPMWTADGLKQVPERATVGARCDCTTPLIKGSQTLCRLYTTPNLAACVTP